MAKSKIIQGASARNFELTNLRALELTSTYTEPSFSQGSFLPAAVANSQLQPVRLAPIISLFG